MQRLQRAGAVFGGRCPAAAACADEFHAQLDLRRGCWHRAADHSWPAVSRGTRTTKLSYSCSGVSGLGSMRANSSGGGGFSLVRAGSTADRHGVLASVRHSLRKSKPDRTKYVGQLVEQLVHVALRRDCQRRRANRRARGRTVWVHAQFTAAREKNWLSRDVIQVANCARRDCQRSSVGRVAARVLGRHDLRRLGQLHVASVGIDQAIRVVASSARSFGAFTRAKNAAKPQKSRCDQSANG